jgi:hypothetical protein
MTPVLACPSLGRENLFCDAFGIFWGVLGICLDDIRRRGTLIPWVRLATLGAGALSRIKRRLILLHGLLAISDALERASAFGICDVPMHSVQNQMHIRVFNQLLDDLTFCM